MRDEDAPAAPSRRFRRSGRDGWPWLVAAAVVALAWLGLRLAYHLWWPIYPTVGGSMYPTIVPGELALVEGLGRAGLHVGEIVLARVPVADQRTYGYAPLVLHRVVAIGHTHSGATWIRTRGDHNASAEPFTIPVTDVVGRLAGLVPYAGYALLFAHSRFGLATMAALFGLYLLYRLVDWALGQAERGDEAAGPSETVALTAAAGSVVAVTDPIVLETLRMQEAALRALVDEVRELRMDVLGIWLDYQTRPAATPWTGHEMPAADEGPPRVAPH